MKELRPGRYKSLEHRWVEHERASYDSTVPSLTLIAYNVWFSPFAFPERSIALLHIIHQYGADLIGLQEVTSGFLKVVLEQDWVREGYFISDFQGSTVQPHGVLLLSRFPIRRLFLHELPSALDRKVLVADFILNGQETKTGILHLESRGKNAQLRAKQLSEIFPFLEDAPHALLMGDFNFDPSLPDESSLIDSRYLDLWSELEPGKPGYTIDTDINIMRFQQKGEPRKVRFDRILLVTDPEGWRPGAIELLGTEPVRLEPQAVFPSDHFGLAARLQWSK